MTEHYKSAAELMEKEYNNAVEKVEKGDDSEENKEAVKEEKELKAKKEEKAKEEKKKQADKDKDQVKILLPKKLPPTAAELYVL